MKNTKYYLLVFFLLFALFICSTFLYYSMAGIGSEESKEDSIFLSERIYDSIECKLQGPISVSKMMSRDVFLIEKLKGEKNVSDEEIRRSMQEYLSGVKKSSTYAAVYVVSEASKRYYTYKGVRKIVDSQNDASDLWYTSFAGSDRDYEVRIKSDPDNNDSLTIFINSRIKDGEGNLLGVCGVGVMMSGLQDLLSEYENKYNVKINTVNAEGLVQEETGSINVETSYLIEQMLSDRDNYVYTNKGNGYIITKYIADADWYLVVQDALEGKESDFDPTFLERNLFLFGCVLILGFFLLQKLYKREKYLEKENSQYDRLTGLPNRNYFKEVYGERGVFNTARYKSFAVFDIDFFKEANDSLDGDAILRSIVPCAQRIIGDEGQIFRWGGDEFAILMQWSLDDAYELCRKFCREVEKAGHVTVSIGVTQVRLSDSIKKNYYRAAQGCYLVKEMGGNGVKRS